MKCLNPLKKFALFGQWKGGGVGVGSKYASEPKLQEFDEMPKSTKKKNFPLFGQWGWRWGGLSKYASEPKLQEI